MNGPRAKTWFASIALSLVITSGVLSPIAMMVSPRIAFAQTKPNYGPKTEADTKADAVPLITEEEQKKVTAENDKKAAADAAQKDIESCSLGDFVCSIVQFIGFVFMFMSNLVATVAGLISDFVIWYSIQSFPYQLVNPFMEAGWKMITSFTNLVFIFALLMVGFSLIFGVSNESINPKRTFAYVVIMALLIQFSFFLSRSVIEIGNTAATILYDKISAPGGTGQADANSAQASSSIVEMGTPSAFFNDPNFIGMKSISLGILNQVNPQQLILKSNLPWKNASFGFYISYLFTSFMVVIFNIVLVYLFISIALLFVGRYVTLALLVVFSPLAFVSVTIPSLKRQAFVGFDDWLKQLIGLTFMAPVYLIFVYLTVLFLSVKLPPASGYLLVAVVILVKLAMVAMILLRGKKMATDMSGYVGEMAGGLINKAAMLGVGAATGGTAFVARNTIGRAGAAIATNGSLARMAESGPAMDIDSVARRQKFASGIRSLGIGKYRLGKTQFGSSLADRIKTGELSYSSAQAGTAQGLRQFGKNLYSVNPLDRSIGGLSGRKVAGMLGAAGEGNFVTNPDGTTRFVPSNQLNKGLAEDYTSTLQKKQARDRTMDIEASKNAKKTITNVSNNAVTSGLGNAAQGGGGSTNANAQSSGAVGVTGPNTRPTNATASTGAPGPAKGVPIPDAAGLTLAKNNFNGNTNFNRPTNSAEQEKEAAEKMTDLYDQQKAEEGETVKVENLKVENLTVANNGGGAAALPPRIQRTPAQTESGNAAGHAANLLSNIQAPPLKSINYKPAAPGGSATKLTYAPNQKGSSSGAQIKTEQAKNQETPKTVKPMELHEDVLPLLQQISQNEQFNALSQEPGALQTGISALNEYQKTGNQDAYNTGIKNIKDALQKNMRPGITVTRDAEDLNRNIESLYQHLPETADDHRNTVNAFKDAL